jgi:hypothetical protein
VSVLDCPGLEAAHALALMDAVAGVPVVDVGLGNRRGVDGVVVQPGEESPTDNALATASPTLRYRPGLQPRTPLAIPSAGTRFSTTHTRVLRCAHTECEPWRALHRMQPAAGAASCSAGNRMCRPGAVGTSVKRGGSHAQPVTTGCPRRLNAEPWPRSPSRLSIGLSPAVWSHRGVCGGGRTSTDPIIFL